MKPTPLGVLAALVVLGAGIGYLVAGQAYARLPPLPAYAPGALAVLGVCEAYWASLVRSRLHRRRPGPAVTALWIARAVALAKASSVVGAVVFGGYSAFAVYLAGVAGGTVANRDATVAAGSAVAALVLLVAAVALERAGRVPRPPEDRGSGDRG